jgi:hypothetical protein
MTSLLTKLTAAAALIGFGGIGGAILGAPAGRDPARAVLQRPAPVQVRTEVVRRTIRIVRHEKPKRRPAPVTAPPADALPAAAPSAPVVATPVARRVAVAPVTSVHRVVTRSSSTGHGGSEHEGGGDD